MGGLRLELEAPGKIILFGEHSVVYGRKAIAATLGLYTRLKFAEDDSREIKIRCSAMNMNERYSLEVLRRYFRDDSDSGPLSEQVERARENFRRFHADHGGGRSLTEQQRYSLVAFFHCSSRVIRASSGFELSVETELPVGSGAGSSASFSVVLATATLLAELSREGKLSQVVTRSEDGTEIMLTDELRDSISRKAFGCETVFHGTPSGIDHSVILHGATIEFVKGRERNSVTPVECPVFKVLLVNTKVERSTKNQARIFREWMDGNAELAEIALEEMGSIAETATKVLGEMKRIAEAADENEARLAELVTQNHKILRDAGLSHATLERICSAAAERGLSAKLTGAGGGGYGFVFLPSKTSATAIDDLKKELEGEGFVASVIELGGPGLRIVSLECEKGS